MIFAPLPIDGAYLIGIEKREDRRGFFGRAWDEREFRDHGLTPRIVQVNVAFNHERGTLRGMHYQVAPDEEAKLVRCTAGVIYDVLLDLRPHSQTYAQWHGVTLTPGAYQMVYVPEGCAHGYVTLVDETEVTYQVSAAYAPQSERGVRYDDPAFNISWPVDVRVISDKDRSWPDFQRLDAGAAAGRAVP